MERFNEFLNEKTEEPLKPSELEIVVLGLSDEEGTFADLIQKVAKKRGMKHTLVDITQAYITSSDIEIGEVRLRNIDGEDKDMTFNFDIIYTPDTDLKKEDVDLQVFAGTMLHEIMTRDLKENNAN